MMVMYDEWPVGEREQLATSWFLNRQSHSEPGLDVFVGSQTRGHLGSVPEAEQLVVFFSSSGDEIAELDLSWDEYLHSQEQALQDLANACRDRPGTKLVVRTHPHMRLKPADDLAEWMTAVEQAGPDTHFDPHSPVDSYALMRVADIVFTYGSTAGVEAAFVGKPVVVMGPSAYDEIGCARRITSADQIHGCLADPPMPDPAKALPYGLMMERRGFNYEKVVRLPGQEPSIAGIPLDDASENVRKLSDAWRKLQTRWLTSR
jgi:hypothetical protein